MGMYCRKCSTIIEEDDFDLCSRCNRPDLKISLPDEQEGISTMSTEQLTGKDIIALGYQQGPSVGIILREANAALENGMQMDVVKSIVAALPTKYADFLDTQFKETAAYWKTFHQQNEEEKK